MIMMLDPQKNGSHAEGAEDAEGLVPFPCFPMKA
jgi:hypothetical protein